MEKCGKVQEGGINEWMHNCMIACLNSHLILTIIEIIKE